MKKVIMFDNISWKRSPKVRYELNREVVTDYAERYAKREKLPAPLIAEVTFNGDTEPTLACIDGMHRIHAMRKNEQKGCECEVVKMTPEEALTRALGSNREHGLRRSNTDKHVCCVSALMAWPNKSNLAIAQMVGVDDKTVNVVRKEMEKAGKLEETQRTDTKGRKVTPREAPEKGARSATDPEDATGYPIPKEIRGAWEDAMNVAEHLTQAVNVLRSNVAEAQEEKDIVFSEVNFSALTGDLDKVWKNIQSLRPHAVCPNCVGHPELAEKGCNACKGRGFISKFRWDTVVPDEVKKMRKKAAKAVAEEAK